MSTAKTFILNPAFMSLLTPFLNLDATRSLAHVSRQFYLSVTNLSVIRNLKIEFLELQRTTFYGEFSLYVKRDGQHLRGRMEICVPLRKDISKIICFIRKRGNLALQWDGCELPQNTFMWPINVETIYAMLEVSHIWRIPESFLTKLRVDDLHLTYCNPYSRATAVDGVGCADCLSDLTHLKRLKISNHEVNYLRTLTPNQLRHLDLDREKYGLQRDFPFTVYNSFDHLIRRQRRLVSFSAPLSMGRMATICADIPSIREISNVELNDSDIRELITSALSLIKPYSNNVTNLSINVFAENEPIAKVAAFFEKLPTYLVRFFPKASKLNVKVGIRCRSLVDFEAQMSEDTFRTSCRATYQNANMEVKILPGIHPDWIWDNYS